MVVVGEIWSALGGRRGWTSTWCLYVRVGRRDIDQASVFCLRILALTALSLRLTTSRGRWDSDATHAWIAEPEAMRGWIYDKMRDWASLQIDLQA